MKLFDKKGNRIEVNTDKFIEIGSGNFGRVFRTEKGALKVMNKDNYYPIDPKVLEYIKDAKLKGFYKIRDIYFDKNEEVKAYTMKFYDTVGINLLEDKDYLLESIYNIYQSILILSRDKIKCLDLMDRNVIKTPSGLKVIDCDYYSRCKNDTSYTNMVILLDTINDILINEMNLLLTDIRNVNTLYPIYHDTPSGFITHKVYNSDDLRECIENLLRELNKYNKPYEYLLKR